MNRFVEIAAMALGGLSLFAVCFLGFAAMAGVPLHEVAVIGGMFPPPEVAPEHVVSVEDEPEPISFESNADAYASSLGSLSAWSLAPPFTADELKGLVDELKLKRVELEHELRQVEQRTAELDGREEALAEQFTALDELRARLEAYETELSLRAEEIARDEAVEASRSDRVFEKLAALLAGQEADEAGRRLTAYSPDEATKILLHLDEKRALEILNTFEGDRYLEYAQAWAEAAGARP